MATELILLGTGTPNPDRERQGPAVAVVVDGRPYLFDAGPGVVRRAAEAGLPMPRLSRAFITHLHSDHTVGLPDLWLSPWTLERTEPLALYGPPGLNEMAAHLRAAYAADIAERLEGLEPANATGHGLVAHEVAPGLVYQDERATVMAFSANHGAWAAYGYRIETVDRTIVISGDTAPREGLAEAYAGADVLLHEVYCSAALDRREPAWQRYHRVVHTSGVELGRIAAGAQPKLLVLYHQLLWGASEEELLAEIRQKYRGEIVSGRDLDRF